VSDVADRRYHHGNLREALLERAAEVLAARGAAELSLREIARDVGVSHAAPRRHFPDRQALLDALALHGFERLAEELTAAAASRGRTSFRTRVTRLAAAYTRFATADAALLELMFAGKHREVDGPLHEASDRAFVPVLELIAEGQASGEIIPGPIDRPGTVLLASLHGLASLINGGLLAGATVDSTVPATIDILLDGLRPR
jgi:AcrR family transcriptional regulator